MKIFKKNKFIISSLLTILLLLPFFFIIITPIVYSANNPQSPQESWLKGILLIIISFIINNFIDKNNSKPEDNKIGDKPLVDNNTNHSEEVKEVLGFYVNWLTPNASSYDSLKNNWKEINAVAPFWYTINPNGNIESRYGGHQYEVTTLASKRNLKVLPLINNNQKNNMILVDPKIRTKAINNLIDLVKKFNYDGVNIDFEFLPPWTRNGYTAFIKELSTKLKKSDKTLTISVFPKIDVPLEMQEAYDYAALAPLIDKMVMMTYDHHWRTGPAGPVAPIGWVEENIRYALEYLPPEKVLLGIANYGYDWPSIGPGKDLSTKEALKIAQDKGAKIQWNKKYQSPFYYYWDNDKKKHEVWFESSNSLAFKLDLVNKYKLKGIAIWRLGNETAEFWNTIEEKLR